MLTMTQLNDIRKAFFEEGLNISQISRAYGFDRKTVRYYIHKDDWNKDLDSTKLARCFPKLDPFKSDIDNWLEEDKKARVKQRHTAKRVYDRLCEKHGDKFNCSYRTVAGYVAVKKKELFQKNTCKLPLVHIPGEAQADFGKADFYENGTLYNGSYLNVSFPNSNAGFLQLFKGENQECLLEGLKNIFEHIGGVPQRIWFDNTSTVVAAILKEGDRKLTDDFLRFKQHYNFETAFCNPASGHEKGSVESKVGYHRRNLLVPVPKFDKLEEFNRDLLIKCDADMKRDHYIKEASIEELFKEDVKALLPLPAAPYDVCDYITVRTNTYAKFSLNAGKHIYSTAPKYANSKVLVKITAYEVIPLDENHREITRHGRLYGDWKQESMQWIPYLTQLSKHPGAFKYSGIYSMMPDPLREYLERCSKSERGKVLQVLAKLSSEGSFEKAIEAVSQAVMYDASDADSLIAIYSRITSTLPELKPAKLPGIPKLDKVVLDISQYDRVLQRGGGKVC